MAEQRSVWLDYIRAIAASLVVLLHTSGSYLSRLGKIDILSWQFGNYVDSFTRVSVPLFFMISGYLFFREKKPRLKHFIRVISALLFYSAIALIYIKFYQNIPINGLLKDILFKPVYYHLWFFYTIIIVYIIATLITIRDVKEEYALLSAVILFVLLNPKLSNITGLFEVTYKSILQLDGNIIYYSLFCIYGAIIGNIQTTRYKFIINTFPPVLYILASILIGYGTYIVSVKASKYIVIFHYYTCVLVAIGAISIFLWIKENYTKLYFCNKFLLILSRNSLAIYGLHPLILNYLDNCGLRNYNNPIVDIPFIFFITLLASLIFAILIKFFDRKSFIT